MINFFYYPFALKALIVGGLVSICAALLGSILVLKRHSLIGHSLADIGFASTSLAVSLGLTSPLIVSMPVVVACSFFIMYLSQNKKIHGDIVIGIFSTSSLAIGVLIASLSQGLGRDVYTYMFGSILVMDDFDVAVSVLLSLIVLGLFFIFYNRLFLVTSDEVFAKSYGININFYHFLISSLTALTIVVGMRMMGTLLISSLVIFPSITAKRVARSFKSLMILSSVVSFVCFTVGLLVSFQFNIPTGASIVLANLLAFMMFCLI
ncbi:MAG: metal ABC transporter permease [Oscillospiraceae bacterium]|jgi:zinc transport system permease protein|nr:metal ABC transporter permease [Oscillospiraceae bacterium]